MAGTKMASAAIFRLKKIIEVVLNHR
jgi:hypothetical protein